MSQRKDNYKRLIINGFTSKEATRFKDLSKSKIDKIIKLKQQNHHDTFGYKHTIKKLDEIMNKKIERVIKGNDDE